MNGQHKPNGPYYPVGLLAGEYCKSCRKPWPCPTAKQAARNELFAAGLRAPQPNQYQTHADYEAAFDAYQAEVMQPLRDKLAAA